MLDLGIWLHLDFAAGFDSSESWIGFGLVDKLALLSQITFAYTFFLNLWLDVIFSCQAHKLLADSSIVASIIFKSLVIALRVMTKSLQSDLVLRACGLLENITLCLKNFASVSCTW